VTLKSYMSFLALEEPWNGLINIVKKHIYSLLSVSDWLESLIHLGGLVLVDSHLFMASISISWMGLEKSK